MKLLLCGSMLCLSVWGAEEEGRNPLLPRGDSAFGVFLQDESPSSTSNEPSPPQGVLADTPPAVQLAPQRPRESSGWNGMHRPESLLEFARIAEDENTADPHVPPTGQGRLSFTTDSLTLTRQAQQSRRVLQEDSATSSVDDSDQGEEPRTSIQPANPLPSDVSHPPTTYGSPTFSDETRTQRHEVGNPNESTSSVGAQKTTERSWLNWFTCGLCG